MKEAARLDSRPRGGMYLALVSGCSGANGASPFHMASLIGVPCWMGLCNEQ